MIDTTEPILLLTRPKLHSEALAARLNWPKTIISPLIEIKFIESALPRNLPKTLILTSQTAVEALKRSGSKGASDAWCVGQSTANAAMNAGLHVKCVTQTALELRDMPFPDSPLLHIAGHHRRGEIVEHLNAKGYDAKVLTAYKQKARSLSQEALLTLKNGQSIIAPLYSPRTALLFRENCPQNAANTVTAICMSQEVAKALNETMPCIIAASSTRKIMEQTISAALSP